MSRTARPGDFLRVDDRSGFTHWASETRKEWNGQIVHRRSFEARHPQDFVKGRRDDQRVPDPRPRPADVFVTVTPAVYGPNELDFSQSHNSLYLPLIAGGAI